MRINALTGTVVIAAVTLLGLAACDSASSNHPSSTAQELPSGEFMSADGVRTDISDTSRLVILNGDLTEIAFALGAGESVVGVDLTTTYPPEATQLPAVGLGRSVNAEKVIRLAPSLVIADTQLGPQTAIDQIRDAGIPIALLNMESALSGVRRKIDTVAGILGLEDRGDDLAATVQGEIDAALTLAGQATDRPRVGYVYVRGPETLLMFGNGMPTHFLIEAAAAEDALGDQGVLFAEDLSAEVLVTAAPDTLITSTEGVGLIGGIDSFLALPGVGDTPAGRSRAVLTYDDALFLGMGPRVGQALTQLVVDLHPELSAP